MQKDRMPANSALMHHPVTPCTPPAQSRMSKPQFPSDVHYQVILCASA